MRSHYMKATAMEQVTPAPFQLLRLAQQPHHPLRQVLRLQALLKQQRRRARLRQPPPLQRPLRAPLLRPLLLRLLLHRPNPLQEHQLLRRPRARAAKMMPVLLLEAISVPYSLA